jgi:hypothetical protein
MQKYGAVPPPLSKWWGNCKEIHVPPIPLCHEAGMMPYRRGHESVSGRLHHMGRNGVKRGRAIKEKVYDLLKSADFDRTMQELHHLSPQKVINPLLSFLHQTDPGIKWAAVKVMGAIVAKMADEDMESARVVMRRLMWNLNDESGGIGWGSPEAMGEILANHAGLAKEYTHILISYARKDGNYLEHDILQQGLLWGIKRLTETRPHLVQDAAPYLLPYLKSHDVEVRNLAEQVLNVLGRGMP